MLLKRLFLLLTLFLFSSLAQSSITLTSSSTQNEGDLALSWSTGSNNQFYLYQDGVKVFLGSQTSHTLTNLSPGTYKFQIDGCYSQGCAYPSSYTLSNTLTVRVNAQGGTTLTASAPISGGDFILSYTTIDPVYYMGRLSVYENGTYIGNTTDATIDIVGKPVGTYSYYLKNCNPGGCYPNSNTVTITVIKEAQVGETLYRYDALGRLVRVDDYENGLVIYEYDATGNRKAVANN
jgi:YD repeat-containing protein